MENLTKIENLSQNELEAIYGGNVVTTTTTTTTTTIECRRCEEYVQALSGTYSLYL